MSYVACVRVSEHIGIDLSLTCLCSPTFAIRSDRSDGSIDRSIDRSGSFVLSIFLWNCCKCRLQVSTRYYPDIIVIRHWGNTYDIRSVVVLVLVTYFVRTYIPGTFGKTGKGLPGTWYIIRWLDAGTYIATYNNSNWYSYHIPGIYIDGYRRVAYETHSKITHTPSHDFRSCWGGKGECTKCRAMRQWKIWIDEIFPTAPS